MDTFEYLSQFKGLSEAQKEMLKNILQELQDAHGDIDAIDESIIKDACSIVSNPDKSSLQALTRLLKESRIYTFFRKVVELGWKKGYK